uniref:Pantoate kinase n=1 Tax=Staphylothermus marinus TaxID=2280 RepID=A0A7C4JMN9_STAMA
MIKVKVPLHVSGLWIPYFSENPLETGSRGAGLNLELFLETRSYAEEKYSSIILNGERVLNNHASHISKRTGKTIVLTAYTPVPLGAGFGVSAAASIAYAVVSCSSNHYRNCIDYAHEAEVIYKTGLGDVVAEFHGGFVIRIKPGSPSKASVIKIDNLGFKPLILACYSRTQEFTPNMLNRVGLDNYIYANELLEKLISELNLESFFKYANLFTRKLFNYSPIDEVLTKYRGSVIGYYLKKSALIIWVEKNYDSGLKNDLLKKGFICIESSICSKGVEVVHTSQSST